MCNALGRYSLIDLSNPSLSGKSTVCIVYNFLVFYVLTLVQVMRMTAVGIVRDFPVPYSVSDLNMAQIMAQLGMLVPAKSARYAQDSSSLGLF